MKTVRGSEIAAPAPSWVPLVCLVVVAAAVAVTVVLGGVGGSGILSHLLTGLSSHIQVQWLPFQSPEPAQACGAIPFPCAPSRVI